MTFNDVVEMAGRLAGELERVAGVVGEEGRFTRRAKLAGAAGEWSGAIDSVNSLIGSLVLPLNEIDRVIGGVAKGNLDLSMATNVDDRPLKGAFLRIANTVNAMIDRLGRFTTEVTRVAREVGTEGKLGGQAKVPGVSGTWKELTDNVNQMADNLTNQVRNIAEVATAVAEGDLGTQITVDAQGEVLELKNTINIMVDQLRVFAAEVTRVAREVGTEGQLGGQATVEGVSGTWKELTDNVNQMADNLTNQVRNIAEVTTAVANGDLTKQITVDAEGEVLELKNTINTMVDQLRVFAAEVTRVAREVGTEGQLGGQATVEGVSGTWKDLTDNVNQMADNLTNQVRNIAEVATAVAEGNLGTQITVDAQGEILELKSTINTMVDQLRVFADEVTRVAREVGTDGVLGGQATVEGVSGTWKDLTDNVNQMANNLTNQVRNIAEVATAVADGDLGTQITVDAQGEVLELKNTINTMVDQLSLFAAEVTRVAREVGTEGQLGGQAAVEGVSGTWKELTDNVNQMADNLTNQVRNIAEVATAVAQGDLGTQITVDAEGEVLELKNTINTMVDQLRVFADEVTRVAREVGTDGVLGGQARVVGVSGTWEDLTDNVNQMADNLTGQVRNIAEVATAVANGDLTKQITVDAQGEVLELKNTINIMVDQLSLFAAEVTRVAREVGTEGQLGGQAKVVGVSGTWEDLTDNVNQMADNLTGQVRNIAEVATAVANGDLTKQITVDAQGEILELKNTINIMVDQLGIFAAEVTRVAREVGTAGVLGGQATVEGVSGTWKDLTDNVNQMADNLTNQVRGIADVVTEVARGNLTRTLTLDAKGEIAELADTINGMIETLGTFADQVTKVAREVGVEGQLGGQAEVPGATGTWRDLTDNVNELAANLTSQVRSITEVATAVGEGDLSRTITVEARGEVDELKNNINGMIRSLQQQTEINTEQDWLKTNLARFSGMLQGQRDPVAVSKMILSELAPLVDAQHGVFYVAEDGEAEERGLKLLSSYAYKERKGLSNHFQLGEGLVGQCALEKSPIVITEAPADYVKINSGLGEAPPSNIAVLPVMFEEEVRAVIELATFNRFSDVQLTFLEQLTDSIGIMLSTIAATARTEQLLQESQSLTEELQSRQDELQQTNEELEEKARIVTEQMGEVERKNREVELARNELEDKAAQLATTSRYKSEFLANMSHELRTPLNSLLILANTLAENSDDNLTAKQVEYAETIQGSGRELLSLINDILDLSKIEAGIMAIEPERVNLAGLVRWSDRGYRELAEVRGLTFSASTGDGLPEHMETDEKRLQQVLKNFLSNAIKFTSEGEIEVRVDVATEGWSAGHNRLDAADAVVAFHVRDTGIGIADDKLHIIFEAFQQADGGTSREYGGTGLGLSISREIARLLGGDIQVASRPGEGSTFTLYLPRQYTGPAVDFDGEAGPDGAEAIILPDTETADQEKAANTREFADDRDDIQTGDRVLLIVEDDLAFASLLADLGREKGFKVVVTTDGTGVVALARKVNPHAITLDIELPGASGWTVLDQLKHNPHTQHIPVHVISVEGEPRRSLASGAIAHLQKPAEKAALSQAFDEIRTYLDRPAKKLLVIEDNDAERHAIIELIGNGDVVTKAVATGDEALDLLRSESFDCIVLDLGLSGMSGFEVIEKIRDDLELTNLPIIVYTGRELSRSEETRLRRVAKSVIVKDAASPERLLQETTLFLHRVEADLPPRKRDTLQRLRHSDPALEGKTVLVVDDDMRNIFAITSIFERHGANVVYAENGKDGIATLKKTPKVDFVLMDIMMPGMDGYETMRRIRAIKKYKKLPIIALTAKAMKGDREKCIEAGASDYISKPIETDQLLSLARVWLYKE